MKTETDDLFAKSVRRHVSQLAKMRSDHAHSLAERALTESEIYAAEARLGFKIPAALSALYTKVANGGFGPAYGLLGLVGGARQEDGNDAVSMYEVYRKQDLDDPHWAWPEKLLPVVHLGCAMFFCVDCSDDEGMVIWFEPNPHEHGRSWDDAFFPLKRTFRDVMSRWVEGEDPMQVFESAMPSK